MNVRDAVPARGYLFRVMGLLVACQTVAYIDRVNVSVATPFLIKHVHYTPTAAGALQTIFNAVFTVAILFAGPFVDRVRSRAAYTAGASTWSIGTMLCGVTTAFAPLAVCRAIVGIGEAPMIPAGQRVIRESFPPGERTRAVGAFFSGNKIGLALGIPLSAVILERFGLPWVFYVSGLLGFVWLGLFLVVYRSPTVDTGASAQLGPLLAAWAQLLRYRTTWGMMLGNAGYLYIYYVFATWLPGYLVLQRHLSNLNSGLVGILPFAAGFVVTILGGWAGDALVARGVRRTIARKGIAVSGLLAATFFTVFAAYATQTVPAVTFVTLAVAGFSFSTAALQAIPVDVAPPEVVSSLAALHNFGGNVGGTFAPVVTGALLAATHSFVVPLVVAAAVALVLGCLPILFLVGNIDREYAALPVCKD